MRCPKHIEPYVVHLQPNHPVFNYDSDDYHIQYLVKCSCGNDRFEVYLDDALNVTAKCNECSKDIIIYDLQQYPPAVYLPPDEEIKLFTGNKGETIFNILVIFEYGELDEGEEFDQNDITWCYIYGYNKETDAVYVIINDETA